MFAYRLLMRRGEWDVDGFLRSIPASKWLELQVADALIESHDAWLESLARGNKKPWQPPEFKEEQPKMRQRLSGAAY